MVNDDPLGAEQALIRQITDFETEIMVTLDLTVLYGKVAAARAKTSLRHVVICKMARALPFFKGVFVSGRALAGDRQAVTGGWPYLLRRVDRTA